MQKGISGRTFIVIVLLLLKIHLILSVSVFSNISSLFTIHAS